MQKSNPTSKFQRNLPTFGRALAALALAASVPAMALPTGKATVDDYAFNEKANQTAIDLAKAAASRPALGARLEGGVVRHPFGKYTPLIECAVGRVCVVEFPENLLSHMSKSWANPDDWNMTFISPRPGVVMMSVSPRAAGMTANLAVYSAQRTYHLKLLANPAGGNYMEHSGFYFPDKATEATKTKTAKQ